MRVLRTGRTSENEFLQKLVSLPILMIDPENESM